MVRLLDAQAPAVAAGIAAHPPAWHPPTSPQRVSQILGQPGLGLPLAETMLRASPQSLPAPLGNDPVQHFTYAYRD